jgi:hypothetical protein
LVVATQLSHHRHPVAATAATEATTTEATTTEAATAASP